MTALVLAALLAQAAPQASPAPAATAAYYDSAAFPAALGDKHADLREAIAGVLGERLAPATSALRGAPEMWRDSLCKQLGVRYLVAVHGGVLVAISGPHPGSKSFDLQVWVWDCRDLRTASEVWSDSERLGDGSAANLDIAYGTTKALLLDRLRKALAAPRATP